LLVWAVVERAADPTCCTLQMLVSRQVQASLDLGAIEEAVVFAAGHIREIAQVGDDCSGPLLAIQAHQRAFSGKAVGLDVLLDGSFRPA
jgi:hypothetical protein